MKRPGRLKLRWVEFGLRRFWTLAFLLGSLFIFSCSTAKKDETPMTEKVFKKSGLRLFVPSKYDVVELADRVALTSSLAVRTPLVVEIRRSKASFGMPSAKLRTLVGRAAHYTLEQQEGGSGGDAYLLRAEMPTGGDWLMMEARMQSEFGRPDFSTAWAIFERSSILK